MADNLTPLEPGASIMLPPIPPEAPAEPTPSESAPDTPPAPKPAPEPTPAPEFWNQLPKEVQERLVKENVTGENLVKHFKRLYDELGKEKAAIRTQPKPEPEKITGTRQAQELKVLKQTLTELAQKDPSRFEEYENIYKAASDKAGSYDEDSLPITRADFRKMLQEEFEAREMNSAALEIVAKAKGKIDPDKAFGIVNGLTASGMSTEDAVKTITDLLGTAEKSAAAEAVKDIVQPKPKTPIVAPGTKSEPPPKKEPMTDDELAKEVLALTLKDAARGI